MFYHAFLNLNKLKNTQLIYVLTGSTYHVFYHDFSICDVQVHHLTTYLRLIINYNFVFFDSDWFLESEPGYISLKPSRFVLIICIQSVKQLHNTFRVQCCSHLILYYIQYWLNQYDHDQIQLFIEIYMCKNDVSSCTFCMLKK